MFYVYIIQLPINWIPRILAFQDPEKAHEVCDALNRERNVGGTGNLLCVEQMEVMDNNDIVLVEEETNDS